MDVNSKGLLIGTITSYLIRLCVISTRFILRAAVFYCKDVMLDEFDHLLSSFDYMAESSREQAFQWIAASLGLTTSQSILSLVRQLEIMIL